MLPRCRPSVVLFDLGGVVCRFNPDRRLAAFSRVTGRSADEIHQALWASGFSRDCDAGRYTAAEMHVAVCERLGCELSYRELRQLWAAAFDPDPRVIRVATALARDSRTGLLTNNPPLLKESLAHELGTLGPCFSLQIFSYEIGSLKPSGALLRAVLDRLACAASAVLLIDDSIENVAAAIDAGWQAVQFTDAAALECELRERGIV